jgi:1,2-diacylglycerol 3-alpha-glucosyltransferase
MNIAMFTNAYEPFIGGLVRSVATFSEDLREAGHRVLVVTLAFPDAEQSSETIFRLPAVKEVGGTQFSFKLPVPAGLSERLDDFAPDIVHSHHPFMLGDTALRVARKRRLPLVFTHHTLYERYAYQFSADAPWLERFAQGIATEYANLCNLVVAPTRSMEQLIRQRGVQVPIRIIPTGIDIERFSQGRRQAFREKHGLPLDAFVLGYLGRVVQAKNMNFIARAAVRFLRAHPDVRFLLVGEGDAETAVMQTFRQAGVGERVVRTGSLNGPSVADAYAAMDLFVFASKTETQGIVLIECLCAGVPAVALDAPGTRDILEHNRSGVILAADASPEALTQELDRLKNTPEERKRLCRGARERAGLFDRQRCAKQLLEAYAHVKKTFPSEPSDGTAWVRIQESFAAEWSLLKEKFSALSLTMETDEPARNAKEARKAPPTPTPTNPP